MSGNNELNKFTHDPEEGPWMTRDRRGRARMEEEVRSNPVVAGPAGEDGTLPTLEINLNSFNHFPTLPLPTGAPLGQGGSLQGPSNQDGGAQAAEGGEQGVNVPIMEDIGAEEANLWGVNVPIMEDTGAGEANLEAPKNAEGEDKPDSEDDDLQVVHQSFMANPTTDLRLKDVEYRARIKASVDKKKQLLKKKSTKRTRGAQEAGQRVRVGGNSEPQMDFPLNQLRDPYTIPRNSETMELDETSEMPTRGHQEPASYRDAVTPGGSSAVPHQEAGVQMEVESNNHDTGAPQGGARTDGNRGQNSAKITDILNNPNRVTSTARARRPPRVSIQSRWEAIERSTPVVMSNATFTQSQQQGPMSQNPLAQFLSTMRQRPDVPVHNVPVHNVPVPDYMSATVLRSHVAQSQAQVGSDDHEPLPPGTEESTDSVNGVNGGNVVIIPPVAAVDDGNQGLSEPQLSDLVERWRLLTAPERDSLNLTEGQASLVAKLARSRKKRQQKLRKNAKTANQSEQVDEYYEMMRERVLDGPSSQAHQPGTGTQGKKSSLPPPQKKARISSTGSRHAGGPPGTTPHSAMGGVTNWLDAYLVRGPESDDAIYGSNSDIVTQQGPVLLSNLRAVTPAIRHHIGRRQVDWFHQPTWGTANVHLLPYGPEAEQTRLLRYHRVTVDRYTNVATIDPPEAGTGPFLSTSPLVFSSQVNQILFDIDQGLSMCQVCGGDHAKSEAPIRVLVTSSETLAGVIHQGSMLKPMEGSEEVRAVAPSECFEVVCIPDDLKANVLDVITALFSKAPRRLVFLIHMGIPLIDDRETSQSVFEHLKALRTQVSKLGNAGARAFIAPPLWGEVSMLQAVRSSFEVAPQSVSRDIELARLSKLIVDHNKSMVGHHARRWGQPPRVPGWDRFVSDPVEVSGTDLHLRPVVRRKEEADTIQRNNVSILESGSTWQAPPGVPAGTKCIFLKQRPLLDLVTSTFAFIEHLDGGW